MTKVIINKVNVSKCPNLAILQDRMTDEEFTFCNAYQEDCSERENCHYKQLKRLQAEYDDLHLSYAGCKTANTGLQELNNELEKENMHYKYLIARIRTIAKTGIEGFCPECSLRYCEENNCYETAIIDIYDLLKKENEDENE